MNDYESVNNEIQNFLCKKRSPRTTEHKSETLIERDIVPLLRSLCSLYNEINTYLRSGNSDALKDVILKSDVKMSLVCETLLETLKMTAEDKNRLCEENFHLDGIRRESEERIAKQKIEIAKYKEETKTRENNLNEMNRILKDQKEKMKEMRNETNEMKDIVGQERIKNEELINLKLKAYERMGIYEKEMEGMKKIYIENEEKMKKIIKENKEEEDNSSGIKMKVAEYEKKIEMLEKRMKTKEQNLMLCNNELSKMIEENKIVKEENEKHKGGSEYYERLYKGVNKQNEYLNRQLSRILEAESYNKDGMIVIKKYVEKIKKQKKRIIKLKKKKREMKKELDDERKKIEEGDETFLTGVTLESRIEDLVEENKGYLEKIRNLEREKKEIENKIESIRSDKISEKISDKISDKRSDKRSGEKISDKRSGEKRSDKRSGEKISDKRNYKGNEYKESDKRNYKGNEYKGNYKGNEYKDNYKRNEYKDNYKGNEYKDNYNEYKDNYKGNDYKDNYKGNEYKDNYNEYKDNYNEYKDKDKREIKKNNAYWDYGRNYLTQNYRNDYIFRKGDELSNKYGKFEELFSSPPHAIPLMSELRKNKNIENIQYAKPNLYNDYEKDKIQIGGFQDDLNGFKDEVNNKIINNGFKDEVNNKIKINGFKDEVNKFKNNLYMEDTENGMFRLLDNKKDRISNDNKKNIMTDNIFETRENKPIIFGKGTINQETELTSKADKLTISPIEDENSNDSLKTYHTTSTLKEMINRTDNLQKKFEDLEEQLANIKEDNSEQKLENKLKTYNSHFSELNIDSNDSDFF